MRKVYIAGPYGDNRGYDAIDANISKARKAAVSLANLGIGFFCPHTHTAHFEVMSNRDKYFYRELDMDFLESCDALWLIGESEGSVLEAQRARALGLPVLHSYEEVIAWWHEPFADTYERQMSQTDKLLGKWPPE